jgi:hypothetical protein
MHKPQRAMENISAPTAGDQHLWETQHLESNWAPKRGRPPKNVDSNRLSVGPIEEVTFVQLSATPYQFRDAVRFSNGREIRLQELSEGMRVRVMKVSLPEDSSFASVWEERKEVFVE